MLSADTYPGGLYWADNLNEFDWLRYKYTVLQIYNQTQRAYAGMLYIIMGPYDFCNAGFG